MHKLTPEHHNRPTHRDTGLGDQSPPVALAIRLLIQALKGAILAEINQILSVFGPQNITALTT
jgi:hypothetical protein